MKRKISAVLAVTMALPTVLTCISGCAKASAEDKMTNGEFIELVNKTFSFEGYQSAEPYFSSIQQGNQYFDAVQTAVEFGVIDERVKDIDPEKGVTREFCAMLLSGAIYDNKEGEVAISDSADITYLDDVQSIINYGIMELDKKGKFNPNDEVGISESVAFTDAAYEVWASCTVDEPVYDVSFKENVVDLSGLSYYSYNESLGSMQFDSTSYDNVRKTMAENNFRLNPESGVITVDSVDELGIKEESVIMLPESGVVKVTEIKENSDGTFTVTTVPATGDEFVANYKVEQQVTPDFTKATFYDANGNPVAADEFVADMSADVGYMSNGNVKKLARGSVSKTFDTEIGKVSVSVGNGYIRTSLVSELASIDSEDIEPEGSPFEYSGNLELNYGYEFNNITFDYKADLGFWDKKYCKFVMNYQTVEKIGLKGDYSQSVKVCSLDCPTGIGDLTVGVDISLGLSIEGEIEVALTTNGRSNGFEWREVTNFSAIKKSGRQQIDVTGHANIEARLPVKLSISACMNVIEAGVIITPGAGADLEIETTQIEEEPGADPTPLFCAQIEVYPILELELYLTIDILIFDKTISKDFEILGSDNVIADLHMESYGIAFPEVVEKCTKEERLKALSDKEMAAAGITIGDNIELVDSVIEVEVGESFDVSLSVIPSGYTFEDFMIVSYESEKVKLGETAKKTFVYNYDNFTGISYSAQALAEGRTSLVVKTKDGDYSAHCTVKITDPNAGTDYSVKLETYGISIPVGTKSAVKITALPTVITENDVLWSSDDTRVVAVDQYGNITARNEGVAIITAATPDKTSVAACSVMVSADPQGNLTINVVPAWVIEEKQL